MSLLILENIHKEYGSRALLNGATLSVHRGERLALVGDNGTGKTTLLRIAMKEEVPDTGSIILGKGIKVGYLSQSLREVMPKDTSQTALQYEKVAKIERRLRDLELKMSQTREEKVLLDLMGRYERLTAEYEGLDGYNIETKIKTTLMGLGLREEALTIPIERLSGGEKMRVALARILLEEPDLLILDEPTNHLDIKAIEWLENFLKSFRGGVLIVSHDRYFLDQVTTRVAELQNGTIHERSGNYSTYLQQKQMRKEFVLREKKRLTREIKETEELIQRLMSMRKIKAARSREKEKERIEKQLKAQKQAGLTEHLGRKTAPIINFHDAGHVSYDIAWAEGLSKSFSGVKIFDNATFEIHGGEKIGIIGPNGCGKTTLINILLGQDLDFEGTAKLGQWVKYGYLGQEIIFQDESRTILEEILSKKDFLEKEAKKYLARYQFYGDEVQKQICVLSGGEKVRVYLATLMLDQPYCLIMDEPTNHLDMAARDVLEKAIIEFKGTVIAISHDRYFLNRCIGRILEVEGNKINSYQGNYEQYRQQKLKLQHQQTQGDRKKENKAENKIKDNTPQLNKSNKMSPKVTQEIETEILTLEEQLKELEDQFGPQADHKIYSEHQTLTNRLNNLYEKWEH